MTHQLTIFPYSSEELLILGRMLLGIPKNLPQENMPLHNNNSNNNNKMNKNIIYTNVYSYTPMTVLII